MKESKEISLELSGLLTLKKSDITAQAKEASLPIKNGYKDGLEGIILVKKAQEFLKVLEAEIKPYAEDRNIEKDYVLHGVSVVQKMNGVKYDYEATGDDEIAKLYAERETLDKAIKERETFLQSLKKPLDVVDDNFEVKTINPPVKSGKLGLSLTIK